MDAWSEGYANGYADGEETGRHEGAAVLGGLIGMAEAIRNREFRRRFAEAFFRGSEGFSGGPAVLVYCRACHKTHAVSPDETPCAPGAWQAEDFGTTGEQPEEKPKNPEKNGDPNGN